MKRNKFICCVFAVLVSCLFTISTAYADVGEEDVNQLKGTIKDLEKQVDSLQDQVKDLLGELKEKPEVPKDIENQIKDLQKEVDALRAKPPVRMPEVPVSAGTMPSWLEGTHFSGDIQLQMRSMFHNTANYQQDLPGVHDPDNSSVDTRNLITDNDRNQMRIRVRYNITKQLNDELLAGFRIATGSRSLFSDQDANGFMNNDGFLSGDRRMSRAVAGNDDAGFNKLEAWIDQAYLKYTPDWLDGLTVWAGKFQENWKHKGLLIHDEGVGFDGIAESYRFEVVDGVNADINLAQLIISESAVDAGDAEMYVFDVGISGTYETEETPIDWGLRGTTYLFAGINQGTPNNFTNLNEGLVNQPNDNPRVLLGTADLGFNVLDTPVSLFAQLGANINPTEDGDDGATRGVDGARKYWALGASVNELNEPGDFMFDYKYAYLERNVMPSGLPDEYLLSGNQVHYWTVSYRWFPSTDLSLRLIAPRNLDGDKETESIMGEFNVLTRF